MRRIHLVDIENLIGSGRLTRMQVAACSRAYLELAPFRDGDLVIVGCNPNVMLEVGLGWDGPHRLVLGHGPDGADRALLRVLEEEDIDLRFAEVVLASGDGIFVDAAADLGASGVRVTLVSRPRSLSRRLRAAAAAEPVPFPDLVGLSAQDGALKELGFAA